MSKFKVRDVVVVNPKGLKTSPNSDLNDITIGEIVNVHKYFLKEDSYDVKLSDGSHKDETINVLESYLDECVGKVIIRWPDNIPTVTNQDIDFLNMINGTYVKGNDNKTLQALIIKLEYYRKINEYIYDDE